MKLLTTRLQKIRTSSEYDKSIREDMRNYGNVQYVARRKKLQTKKLRVVFDTLAHELLRH